MERLDLDHAYSVHKLDRCRTDAEAAGSLQAGEKAAKRSGLQGNGIPGKGKAGESPHDKV